MAWTEAPISSTPCLARTPALCSVQRQVEAGLAAQRRQDRVGLLDLREDLVEHLDRERLDVGRVGQLGVGHDRGRVGVDQDDPQPSARSALHAWVPE
jgi:hypothetical protein